MKYEIRPPSKFNVGFSELWEYRELLYFYTWRDIKVKYKQTVLGILWVIFQPLIMMVLFTFLLRSKFSDELYDGLHYSIFILSGLLSWISFSSSINNSGNAMISNAAIIKKIYFPRLIIPLSSMLVAFFDFIICFIIYVIAVLYYKPTLHLGYIFLVPVSVLILFLSALGISLFTSALNVKYRDFRYILPFFIQSLMFVSPVIYPFRNFSQIEKIFLALNPIYAPIQLFRMHLTGDLEGVLPLCISLTSMVVLLITGIIVFRKTEKYFADLA